MSFCTLPVKTVATSSVTEADLRTARLGSRFGRLDLASRLAVLAVERLGLNFDSLPRERIAVTLAAAAGSLSTDIEYWNGRDAVGGPSPTLFAYTLPSAAVGEIAIRYRLTGPNLCFVGEAELAVTEGAELIRRGEAGGCVCVWCQVLTPKAAQMIGAKPAAMAEANYLEPE
jgi:3-oxoacyl-(acyl-carrier-protein) synthase